MFNPPRFDEDGRRRGVRETITHTSGTLEMMKRSGGSHPPVEKRLRPRRRMRRPQAAFRLPPPPTLSVFTIQAK
ncbi:hypothetical protein EYF80_011725 [Liparis tanakae]|uniref:Uncharacterized protein n=1 Tax=Liparis tanakae TaxID=230148 RepID=A0A4Z2IL98_9TELE|nr:hypothetical protein EYF80_011725 [Liparis tanakae]